MWLDDGDIQLYHGDALEVLAALPAGIAQTCVTSPPFFQLRDYGVDGQIGLEATVAAYVARLVDVFREVRRVLRDDATLWLELGDSYGQGKQLAGVPWMMAFALQADGWVLRADVVWSRPNPMPESVTDRPTKSHSYVFLLAKQANYMYDADAIREPHSTGSPTHPVSQYADAVNRPMYNARVPDSDRGDARRFITTERVYNPLGRNARSVWEIATQPTPEAHFATYPEALVRRCIQAGSNPGDTVLDPFVGSGTTCLVARKHGRRAIGIDLSEEYLRIAAKRTAQLSLLGEAL